MISYHVSSNERLTQNPQTHPYLRRQMYVFMCIVLAFSCKYSDNERSDITGWLQRCQTDFQSCPGCFPSHQSEWQSFQNRVRIDQTFTNTVNRWFGFRSMQYAVYMERMPAIVQHYANHARLQAIANRTNANVWLSGTNTALAMLANHRYDNSDEIDGVQLYPTSAMQRFVRDFGGNFTNPMMRWALMYTNAEPMLMATLHGLGFAVPSLLLSCGFVIVQSYEGEPLARFYGHAVADRLYIGRQLLEAALLFTNGHAGFRFYLTDATADNIVVNAESLRVSFVDLDGVVAVLADHNPFSADAEVEKYRRWSTVHRHEEIEACPDCFAFVVEDLHDHHISDMNVFCACQLLTRGLFNYIPDGWTDSLSSLHAKLMECQQCGGNCPNRFDLAKQLIDMLTNLIELFSIGI